MRLAIMQPYFFPYLGYFSLIAATDQFVVFDPVQYIRHGWINRNRILKPDRQQSQYITVPLSRHHRSTRIRDIRISSTRDWRDRIVGQIQHYKKTAPFFRQAESILRRGLAVKTSSIVELNVHCLRVVCDALKLSFRPVLMEEIHSPIEPAAEPGEWALHIATAMEAEAYINPSGGQSIFDRTKFRQRRIDLAFIENHLSRYPQKNVEFIPGLSIIDVLMFNDFEETNKLINDYQLTE